MSSLDELFFSEIAYREVPEGINLQIVSPARTVSGLLQKISLQMDQHMLQNTFVQDNLLKTMAELAVKVYQARVALAQYTEVYSNEMQQMSEHLTLICNQMDDCIEEGGLTIMDPGGQHFHDVKDVVNVDGWVKSDAIATEQVLEVREPVVFLRSEDRLLRKGRVIMGSPSEAKFSS